MKIVKASSQYKKDFKRIKNDPEKVADVLEIIRLLENELPIPDSFNPHRLTGNYQGCIECHVQNDLLLIWMDESENLISILRLGSHSELFSKKRK